MCIGMIVRGQAKKKINLVVGSDRNQKLDMCYGVLMNNVFGPNVDTSHTNSFGGEAVTFHFYPSWVKGAKHNVGDASVYDFSKYEIKHALLEKFYVYNDDSYPNFTCNCIGNISKAMKTGAILEIELNLSVVQMDSVDYAAIDFSVNPFQGYIDFDVRIQASNVLAYEEAQKRADEFSPAELKELKIIAQECGPSELCDLYVRAMREAVEFYQQFDDKCDIKDSFFERTRRETHMIIEAVLNECKIFTPFHVNNNTTQEFFHFVPHFRLVPSTTPDGFYECDEGNNKKLGGYAYSLDAFCEHSHVNVVLNSVAAEHNKPYIVTYLQSVGFKDVTVERRTNEHNGRQNVWMVRAVKV